MQDIEIQNLYAQLKQKNAEFQESRNELACVIEEKSELEGRVNLYKYCDVSCILLLFFRKSFFLMIFFGFRLF